jgi:hypothetical protein
LAFFILSQSGNGPNGGAAPERAQTDAARVLGHAIAGMSYGVYSTGPCLKRLAAVVEEINYDVCN